MFELIPYLPWPLLAVTVILVVIPTAIAIMARIALYNFFRGNIDKVSRLLNHNQQRGIQPKIVNQLEERYKSVSQQVEQVNTVALIDSIFAEEVISIPGLSLHCDQIENLCRTLPNLLLAFGLLGTFWGITSNLYKVGQAIQNINQTGTDINLLIQELQPQLQGMSIAFLTSLVALLCSSILIIINVFFNTGLAKYKLINALEDYLDNIFRPNVQGDTRLDKAIDRMVTQQHEFLIRFHENVGQVLEDTFGRAALQISRENSKASTLAEKVYTGFVQSAKMIVEGAETFNTSAQSLKGQTQILAGLMPQFQKNSEMIFAGANSFYKVAAKIEKNQFFEQMENILERSSQTHTAFSESSQILSQAVVELVWQTQTITNLAEQVYQNLATSSGQIQDSALRFLEAASMISDSDLAEHFTKAVHQWSEIQDKFSASTKRFCEQTDLIEPLIGNITQVSEEVRGLGNQIKTLSRESLDLTTANLQLMQEQNKQFLELQQHLLSAIQGMENRSKSSYETWKDLTESWLQNSQTQIDTYSSQHNKYLEELREQLNISKERNQEWTKLNDSLLTMSAQLTETWNQNIKKQISAQSNDHQEFLRKFSEEIELSKMRNRDLEKLLDSIVILETNRFKIEEKLMAIATSMSEQIEWLHQTEQQTPLNSKALPPVVKMKSER